MCREPDALCRGGVGVQGSRKALSEVPEPPLQAQRVSSGN